MPFSADLGRLLHTSGVILRHGLVHRFGHRARVLPWLGRRLPDPDLEGPERLRQMIEEMGGTFVKFGQMLALQPDILPRAYCDALFQLLDRVAPFSFEEAHAILEQELGRPPEQIFDRIEEEALATASIGQVHVAYRHGEKVAVKIQRPNAERDFGADLRLMAGFTFLVQKLRLGFLYWLLEPMNEFQEWTKEELDFRFEAKYTDLLRSFARNNPVQVVPRVYEEFVTRRVLVVEFLPGRTLLAHLRTAEDGSDAPPEDPPGFDRRRFAANVIDNFLGDAFGNGIYHADLHPANLMVLRDSVVGYIDFGITGVMSRHARRHLVAMTLALSVGDMDLLSEHFLQLAAHDPKADPEAFRSGLERLSTHWYERSGSDRTMSVNFTRIMTDMLHLSRRTHLLPERDIVKYIRSSIAIDGLVTRFEPDFDVGQYLAERCSRYLLWQGRREKLGPERLLDWAAASGKLMRDGPRRLMNELDRLAMGSHEPLAPTATSGRRERTAIRQRWPLLGGAALGIALLSALGDVTQPAATNLATFQIAFVLLVCVWLIVDLFRAPAPS